MNLLPDWKRILRKAGSVRWALVSGFFGGLEVVLPLFQDSMPRGYFAAASMLAAVAVPVARVVAQKGVSDG